MSRLVVAVVVAMCAVVVSPLPVLGMEEDDPTDNGVSTSEELIAQIVEDADPNKEKVDFGVRSSSSDGTPRQQGRSLPPGWSCESFESISNDLIQPVYDFAAGEEAADTGFKTDNDRVRATIAAEGTIDFDSGAYPLTNPDASVTTSREYSPSGRWSFVQCRGPDDALEVSNLFPIGGPPVTLGELFAQAMGQIDPPIHEYEMRPDGKQLVQLPSLFWVDPAYWNLDRSSTVGNGNVTLTLSLVPYESEWDPGDGSVPVVCAGPGDVWSVGVDPENFTCTHTYRSVEGEPYSLSSTVRFEVRWETNSSEVLGPFAPLERVSTVEVGVREIQVVESSG